MPLSRTFQGQYEYWYQERVSVTTGKTSAAHLELDLYQLTNKLLVTLTHG